MKRCCCCCSLKGGTITIGIYTLVVGLILVGITYVHMTGLKFFGSIFSEEDSGTKAYEIVDIILMVIYSAWAFTGLLLFVAVCSCVRGLLLPWIILSCIMELVMFYNGWLEIKLIIDGMGNLLVFLKLGGVILDVLFQLYLMVAIGSYFKIHCNEDMEMAQPV